MTTRIIALWIVLAAILGFAFGGTLVWSTQKAPPNNREYPAKAEAQDSRARKTPINSITDEKHNGGKQKENWYQTFLDHTPDWFVAIFTLLLAFITYRLVASTNRLWEAGERQLKIAGKTASVAINVERPYVYVSEIELRRVPLPEGKALPLMFTFPSSLSRTTGAPPRLLLGLDIITRSWISFPMSRPIILPTISPLNWSSDPANPILSCLNSRGCSSAPSKERKSWWVRCTLAAGDKSGIGISWAGSVKPASLPSSIQN